MGVDEWTSIVDDDDDVIRLTLALGQNIQTSTLGTETALLRCPHTQHRQTNSLDNVSFQMYGALSEDLWIVHKTLKDTRLIME